MIYLELFLSFYRLDSSVLVVVMQPCHLSRDKL